MIPKALREYFINIKYLRFHIAFGLNFHLTNRVISKFVEKHPKTYWCVKKWDKIANWVHDVTEIPRQHLWNFVDYIKSGPKRIEINSINRVHYHEWSTLILHSNFQLLCDFIEMDVPYAADNRTWEKVYGITKVKIKKNARYPEIGVEYLKQTASERNNEILALYEWWIRVGSHRGENNFEITSDEVAEISGNSSISDIIKLDNNYAYFMRCQETEMLNRFIAIRDDLWI